MTTSEWLQALVPLVADLPQELPEAERYRRLLATLRRLFPCDAVALLRLEGDTLVPLAVEGLVRDTLGRRFRVAQHPRLAALLDLAGNALLLLAGTLCGVVLAVVDPGVGTARRGVAIEVGGEIVSSRAVHLHVDVPVGEVPRCRACHPRPRRSLARVLRRRHAARRPQRPHRAAPGVSLTTTAKPCG